VQVFRGGFGSGTPQPCKDQVLGGCVCGSNGAATTKAAVEAGYATIWDPPRAWYLSCYSDKCDATGGGAGADRRKMLACGFSCGCNEERLGTNKNKSNMQYSRKSRP
jgi:hypothetical protein